MRTFRQSSDKFKVVERPNSLVEIVVQKNYRRNNRIDFVFCGFILSVYLNSIITWSFPSDLMGILIGIGIVSSFGAVIFVSVRDIWDREKRLGKTRKFRLFFFGISSASFIFAVWDLAQFLFGGHGVNQQLFAYSDSFPYFWIANIPLISFLASAVSGGFFSLLERFLELHEKKDL